MRGRSSTDRRRPRRPAATHHHRAIRGAAGGLALLASLIAAGCRPDPPEIREARAVVKEFTAALRRHDDERLRAISACVVSTEGVRDARFRYLEPLRSIRVAALDSLASRYAEAHRLADSVYSAAPDSTADLEARFERARDLARRAATTRAARRGADVSRREAEPAAGESRGGGESGAGGELKTIRAHVLVRFAGEAVGPDVIERDTIVRLVRAPGGDWVVYAFDLASDSPGPFPY